jgi:two-component system, response regulator
MNKHVILLAEDNPDDVTLTLLAFKQIKFPHRIVVAEDGEEALDYLFGTGRYAKKCKPPTPLLIILDLNMPKVNGLEVLREIRRDPWLRHIIVAVLTSSNSEADRVEAMKLGANIYLRKAIDFEEFVGIARTIDNLVSAVR